MPAIDYDSRVHVTRVADRCELAAGVILLGLEAPELVRATRPGQYVMAIPPTGESAATALGIYEAQGARASLLFFPTGKRTHELAALRPGERLDVVGPLGNGFDLSGVPPHVAIVAGGVGIASVLLAAQALLHAGARVELYYGARTAELLVDARRFEDAGCELVLATDDGSARSSRIRHRALGTASGRGNDLGVRSVADAARRRKDRLRARHTGAALARRNVCVRRRRMLGMRRTSTALECPGTELPARLARRQRRCVRADLQGRPRFPQRRVAVVSDGRRRSRKAPARRSDTDGQRVLRIWRGVRPVRRPSEPSARSSSKASRGFRGLEIRRLVSCTRRPGCSTRSVCRIRDRLVRRTRTAQVCRAIVSADRKRCRVLRRRLRLRLRTARRDDAIAAIELNISCPNVASEGETFACDPALAGRRRAGGPYDDRQDADRQAFSERHGYRRRRSRSAGRGRRRIGRHQHGARDGYRRRDLASAVGKRHRGLSGPAIRPIAVLAMYEVARAVTIPIVGQGGIETVTDAVEFFLAGATAVGIGTANFTDPRTPERIAEGLRDVSAARAIWQRSAKSSERRTSDSPARTNMKETKANARH